MYLAYMKLMYIAGCWATAICQEIFPNIWPEWNTWKFCNLLYPLYIIHSVIHLHEDWSVNLMDT